MDTPTSAQPPATPVSTEDKTVAIIAYITLLGFIAAIIVHSGKKTQLGAYHLRQALGLVLTSICIPFLMIIPILGWIAAPILGLVIFVFAILGFISAVQGKMTPVPVLGEKYQQWFSGAFN